MSERAATDRPESTALMLKGIRNRRQRAFLVAFSTMGIITRAAQAAGVARTMHYEWLEDPHYAEAFDTAKEMAVETMEAEAWRRAMVGVREPVYYKGEVVGTVNKPSDTLMIFLLKAARPEKYRDNQRVEHTGPGGGPVQHEHRVAHVLERARALRSGMVIPASVSEAEPGE